MMTASKTFNVVPLPDWTRGTDTNSPPPVEQTQTATPPMEGIQFPQDAFRGVKTKEQILVEAADKLLKKEITLEEFETIKNALA